MILEQIRRRASADIQHIILPEGDDIRTLEAASACTRDGVAKITVIANEEKARELAASAGLNLNGVTILDHRKEQHEFGKMATLYHQMLSSWVGERAEPLTQLEVLAAAA